MDQLQITNKRRKKIGKKIPWKETEIDFLIDNYKDMTWSEIAKELNRSLTSVLNKRTYLGLRKSKVRKQREYAAYKNDEMIAIGTAQEVAEQLDKTVGYIRWCSTPSAHKQVENRKDPINAFTVIKLD